MPKQVLTEAPSLVYIKPALGLFVKSSMLYQLVQNGSISST